MKSAISSIAGLSLALLVGCGKSDAQQAPPPTAGARPSPQASAKVLRANGDLSNLSSAIGMYQSKTGHLPVQLSDLVKNPQASGWRGSADIPKDPWGHAYIYHPGSGDEFKLLSAGPDGTEGTADDISN